MGGKNIMTLSTKLAENGHFGTPESEKESHNWI